MKKKEIYIPIELKVREFFSQILLSFFLSELGFRVYLGSKNKLIDVVLRKKTKGGIFLFKGGLHEKYIDNLMNKIDYHVIIDQEIGPGIGTKKQYEEEIPGRFHKKTIKSIHHYFTVNRRVLKIAKNKLKKINGKVIFTGWPRIDLWKKKYKFLFDDQINKIKKKYDNYILFNSDFAYVSKNYKSESTQYYSWYLENNKSKIQKYLKIREILAKEAYLEFLEFIKILKNYANKNPKKKIVIRPHPAENIDSWYENLGDLKNVFVEKPHGDVIPWIYAASGVLHRGCTTGLQSLYMGKPTAFLIVNKKKFKHPMKEKKIPYKLSYKINNINQLEDWVNKSKLHKFNSNYLNNELGISKKDAVFNISKILSSLKMNKVDTIKISKEKNILFNKLKIYKNFFLKIILIILNTIGYNEKSANNFGRAEKIFNGINNTEIKTYINKLNNKYKKRVKSYQFTEDCVIIED